MAKNHICDSDCGCTPALFTDMMESAGWELSRRDFIKSITAAGGLVAAGGVISSEFSACKAAETGEATDSKQIPDIQVLETIKDGATIYMKKA